MSIIIIIIIIIKLLIFFLGGGGLSLRAQSWVFLAASMSMAPGYFRKNQQENRTKRIF